MACPFREAESNRVRVIVRWREMDPKTVLAVCNLVASMLGRQNHVLYIVSVVCDFATFFIVKRFEFVEYRVSLVFCCD